MLTIARTGPEWKQESDTQPRLFGWIAGTQALERSPLAPKSVSAGSWNQEPGGELNPGAIRWEMVH